MITEDFVSFEVAKLLKEKGFDVPCLAHWFIGTDRNFSISNTPRNWNEIKTNLDWLSCPTLQMAMAWLREVHNLFIQIEFDPPTFSADIYKMDEIDEYGSARHIPPTFANAKSYEEAIETALKYSLENLHISKKTYYFCSVK